MRFGLIFFLSLVAQAETNTAFTGYEKLIEVAFPPIELSRNYSRPSSSEERALRNVRNAMVSVIQTIKDPWVAAVAGPNASNSTDQRALIEMFQNTPIYICNTACNCGGGASAGANGCAKGKQVGDAFGAIITIEPCALTQKGCIIDVNRKKGIEKRLLSAFEEAFSQIAFWKFNGIGKPTSPQSTSKKDRERARGLLDNAIDKMKSMQAACPRKFPDWGYSFLAATQNLFELNTYQARCAQRILSPLAAAQLPTACRAILNAKDFQKLFKENLFRFGFKANRCEVGCAIMTCGSDTATDARLVRFGEKKWTAFVPAGMCEGQFPVNPYPLIVDALKWVSSAPERDLEACAKAVYQGPLMNREKTEGKKETGVDIELIPVETDQ